MNKSHEADAKYYQRINGRDASPPVRLKKKSVVAEKREQYEQQERQDSLVKQRATQNIVAALHERYEELKSN